MKYSLRNRDVILGLALVLGLTIGKFAGYTEKLVLPALGLVMTLSVLGVPNSIFRSPLILVRPTLAGVVCSYILLGGLLVGLSRVLIQNEEIRNGFVIMATVPPAVAIIPFTTILHGDQIFSLLGTVGAYLSALLLTPLLSLLLLGKGVTVHPLDIAIIVGELILLPPGAVAVAALAGLG
jgi:bile acid:Na+ symporter, BASS family